MPSGVIVNVEEWPMDEPMARQVLPTPQGTSVIPDITNYAWYEYGLRVGFWRIKDVLDRHGLRATLSLNAAVCDACPRVVEESLKSGWEMLGHSYFQRPLHLEKDERATIKKTIQTIKGKTGQMPRGWMGPGLAETMDSLDILAEEGIEYVCDWCHDDQPVPLTVKKGNMHSIPYTLELNDLPMYVIQHHRSSEIYDRARDQFDTFYREGATQPRIMAISTHPFVTGVPHRIGYFEKIFEYLKQHEGVVFWTGSQVLDWYKEASVT